MRCLPLEHQQVLAHHQQWGPIKNKSGCLENHKGLRDNQEPRASFNDKFQLHKATPSKPGEVIHRKCFA